MAYIKSERLDGDKDCYSALATLTLSPFEKPTTVFPNPRIGCSLSSVDNGGAHREKRSLAVQGPKQSGKKPGFSGRSFETTGFITNANFVVEVSHMLLDTGADSTFISRAAAEKAHLRIRNCPPKDFTLADGSTHTVRHSTELRLYMAGVQQKIMAYVEQRDTGHHMLLGNNTLQQFLCDAKIAKFCWTVAQDQTGLRANRRLLRQDSRKAGRILRVLPYPDGMRLAMKLGETITQRKSRKILERHRHRGRQLQQRHEHKAGPLYKGGAQKFFG